MSCSGTKPSVLASALEIALALRRASKVTLAIARPAKFARTIAKSPERVNRIRAVPGSSAFSSVATRAIDRSQLPEKRLPRASNASARISSRCTRSSDE